jgi:cytochrome c-type biogenesis protein CcmH
MIRRVVPALALAAVVVVALVIGGGGGDGRPRSAAARTEAIAGDIRCPICQGLSVADSHTPTAEAMKEEIRRRIDAGESDTQIRASFVARYSEEILLRPETSGVSALVWILPVAALLLAVGGLAFAFRRWRRQPTLSATDEDRALVEAALAGRQGDNS